MLLSSLVRSACRVILSSKKPRFHKALGRRVLKLEGLESRSLLATVDFLGVQDSFVYVNMYVPDGYDPPFIYETENTSSTGDGLAVGGLTSGASIDRSVYAGHIISGVNAGFAKASGTAHFKLVRQDSDEPFPLEVTIHKVDTSISDFAGSSSSFSASVQGHPFEQPFRAKEGDEFYAAYEATSQVQGMDPPPVHYPATTQGSGKVSFDVSEMIWRPRAAKFEYQGYSIVEGESLTLDASFSINPGSLSISYRWEVSKNGGQSWANLAAGEMPTISAAQLAALGLQSGGSPYQVRVVGTESSENYQQTSDPVPLDVFPPPLKALVSVPSKFDELGTTSDSEFGTYLSGVKLPTEFTVKANNAVPAGAKVIFQVGDNIKTKQTKPYIASGVKFTFDPGSLTEDSDLTVDVVDKNGNTLLEEEYVGTIKVIKQLPFELTVTVPGRGIVNASDLRLIAGIKTADLVFSAKATGLPLNEAYAGKLAITMIDRLNRKSPKAVTFDANDTAQFTMASSIFMDVVKSDTLFDYDGFLVPAASFATSASSPAKLSAANETARLFVIAKPTWLSTAVASFTSDAGIQKALGIGTAGYAFKLNTLAITTPLDISKETAFGLFNGLKSSIKFGVDVWLYARLTGGEGDVVFKTGDVTLNITLLDSPVVVNKKFTPEQLGFAIREGTGQINAKLLAASTQLIFSPTTPLNVLALLKPSIPQFARTFGIDAPGSKKWNFIPNDPAALATGGLLKASFDIYAKFKANFEAIDLSAELIYDLKNGALSFNKNASSISLALLANGSGQVTADLTVNSPVAFLLNKLKLTKEQNALFQASIRGTMYATVVVYLKVSMGTGKIIPTESIASLAMLYNLEWNVEFLKSGPSDYRTLATASTISPLFGLPIALP